MLILENTDGVVIPRTERGKCRELTLFLRGDALRGEMQASEKLQFSEA